MFRKYSRMIAAVVLGFFTWTSGGVFSVAHAAMDGIKKGKAQEQQQNKAEGVEERFSRFTEELASVLADSKVTIAAKRERLKTAQGEVAALDGEIRKQFADTEKKLKEAKLPAEILERHYKFVKHYDDNLAELQANLAAVEKAKDNKEAGAAMEKARLHLEKAKAPSRHQKLDPNNLPFRQPNVIKREPRMTKEEFEKDLKKDKNAWRNQKRVMVAATGSLAGLLPSDDLAETVEVQFTPEIKSKAQELGNNPVKIYEWVRNNIEFVPTWGSIQGAQMTLLTKQGNAFDAASLLIALLRAAGISARYVTGTVELPIDKVMNWVGGFTDPNAALNFMASGGIPVTGMRSGGNLVSVRIEHVWVRAFIDYVPSLGAVHRQGNTWIPLDASFKTYNYTDGIDFKTVVPFDGQAFADQMKMSSTINEQEGYVTNVSSTLIGTTLSDYNARLQSYVDQNFPNATAADITGKKEIIRKEQAILPASLPYKIVVAGTETSDVPAQLRQRVNINLVSSDLFSSAGITYDAILPELAGKRVTISYDPATPADKAIIDNYASTYATSIPAYLIQLKPVLRIENAVLATGIPVSMGTVQNLTLSISALQNTQLVTHSLLAGDYTAIGLNPSKIGLDLLQNRIDKNDYSEPVGEMLHQTALSYWAEADAFNDVIAKTLRVRNLRHPSELAATAKVSIVTAFGVPLSASYKSRNIDVKLDNQSVVGKAGSRTDELAYMRQSGANSSFLEGAIFDQLFGKNIGDSISAVSVMKLANDQGVPIYGIDATNVTTVLPKLTVPEEIKNEVENAVNAGLTVQIPKTNVTQLGWTGVGYIVSNPADGSGAYRISGGLNGGDSPAEGTTVISLPVTAITGAVAFVVNALMANVKVLSMTVASSCIQIAIPPIAIAIGDIIIWCLIFALVVAVGITMPPNYQQYRHYTTYLRAASIWSSGEIWMTNGWFRGDLIIPGAYITDLMIEPDNLENRKYIAETLRVPRDNPDPDSVVSYVDVKIDKNRVLILTLSPFIYKHQYLHPFAPLVQDYTRIIFTGHGLLLSPP